MKKGVFLDRDGVICKLIFNPLTGEYESPLCVEDMEIYPKTVSLIKQIAEAGYLLFLVSNQPSYAKGKTTMENLVSIHRIMHDAFVSATVYFAEYYYCYHHPEGIVPGYSGKCHCRKPSPYFLQKAAKEYSLDMAGSWMLGDQDSDVFCGQAAGVRTILIDNEHSACKRGKSRPDYAAKNLEDAVALIMVRQ